MPRQARKASKTGIYHILLRGINQQQIFYDEEDFDKFLRILNDNKEVSGYQVYAYCLMGNHIHILIKEDKDSIGQIIKRIGLNFVYWYNVKYQRIGHLFQDRFKSEPVEDEKYLLNVLRYIHQNPVKAGICSKAKDYKYSSYFEYIGKEVIIDSSLIYKYISEEYFEEFHKQATSIKCLDIEETYRNRITDEKVKVLIKKYTNISTIIEYQNIPDDKKEKCTIKLYQKGASIRQISRLTGVSKKIIEKWLKRAE